MAACKFHRQLGCLQLFASKLLGVWWTLSNLVPKTDLLDSSNDVSYMLIPTCKRLVPTCERAMSTSSLTS